MSYALTDLAKGRSYRKIYPIPHAKWYCLYVDEANPVDWVDLEDHQKPKLHGCFIGADFTEEKGEEKHCFGLIVCPKTDIATVVHECCHAAFSLQLFLLPPTCETFDDAVKADMFDEWQAIGVQLLTEQILGLRTWKEILEEYKHAPNSDSTGNK